MSTHVVIMAGGIGSRFWPISTPEIPKQFIDVLGCGSSLIQMTYKRLFEIADKDCIWVITNAKYYNLIRTQLPDVIEDHIILEPIGRNTAPCVALACWKIKQEDEKATIIITPSDALVLDSEEYRKILRNAISFSAMSDKLVTIGIKPNRPETGYGYIHYSPNPISNSLIKVDEFREKPSIELANQYLDSGEYLWNAGIFIWNVSSIEKALRKYKPKISQIMDEIIRTDKLEELFPTCEKISIDYAVMEPASKDGLVYVIPADFGWSDLGNWASLHENLTVDSNNNASVGEVDFFDSKNNIVHVERAKQTIIQGLDGYIVAEKDGNLLICKKSEEQRIKLFMNNN